MVFKKLKRMLGPQKKPKKPVSEEIKLIPMKEIYGDPRDKDYVKKFKTKALGVTFKNIDGSSRQEAIKKLKVGPKVRLIWNKNNPKDSNAIMLFPSGKGNVAMETCFGHLNASLAADVVHWADKKEMALYAEVEGVLSGTKELPTLGCLIEITTYHDS